MTTDQLKYVYFAYGSNLDNDQVARRTPGAVFLGRGILHGYRLTFCSHSIRWGGGVANIEKAPGESVYGVMWAFSRKHIVQMDEYEGFPTDYDRVVERIESLDPISFPGRPKELPKEAKIPAIVYVMKRKQDYADLCPASPLYFNQIAFGYKKHSFPLSKLEEANAYSKEHEIAWNRIDDQMDQLKNTLRLGYKATAAHLSILELTKSLTERGIRHVIAPDGSILVPKDSKTHEDLSSKVQEIIKILQRDPTNSMKVAIEMNTNVPNNKRTVTIKNNSMIEGSWILTTQELAELFDHKDYFPVELQLTTEETSE